MKRVMVLAGMFLLAVSATAADTRVSFQLNGGLNYATGGDLARGIRGYDEYLGNEFNAAKGLKVPILGFQFAGEFLYHFNDRIAVGLGVGYFEHMKDGKSTYSYYEVIDVGETIHTKFRVLPLTANFHYALPLAKSFRLDLSAGAGCYLTALDYSHRQDLSLFGFNGNIIYSFESVRAGFGGHVGIGLEWVIDPKFSLLLNITGRLASVSGFTGDYMIKGKGDIWNFEQRVTNCRIWFGKLIADTGNYDFVAFVDKEPKGYMFEGQTFEDYHEARLGLSGFAATLGFKIGLF